jgi:hypothetical protein
MQGLITERHFDSAERLFPGIRRLYSALARKPSTFLDLLLEWERRGGSCPVTARRHGKRARRPAP